ncbi:manganese catalase family protein [Mucilaginibacter roseus]|uniref:Manganese catalase family protein n=1 Tax=Mucilaginibacter roseus TaxID=1528868 RepID=A0ABS8U4Z4_9SPHI|nr:manganese catalase family protein [Mucilaginibacter roseus]MCD8742181.1 manganese catalase family protein [Mucilaginibacter roseus]
MIFFDESCLTLVDTGTEEISHIEMLSTAVALNLEGATQELKDKVAGESQIVSSILGGVDPRHVLSSGLAARLKFTHSSYNDMRSKYAYDLASKVFSITDILAHRPINYHRIF